MRISSSADDDFDRWLRLTVAVAFAGVVRVEHGGGDGQMAGGFNELVLEGHFLIVGTLLASDVIATGGVCGQRCGGNRCTLHARGRLRAWEASV